MSPQKDNQPVSRPCYAHTATQANGSPDPDRAKWQPLAACTPQAPGHLDAVAALAADFASALGAADWARFAGLWHDLGKFSDAFQNYLSSATDPDADGESDPATGRARGPDHSTAGAQHAAGADPLLGPLLAYLIAGHHAGLPNGRDESQTCLEVRLRKTIEPWLDHARAAGCAEIPAPFPRPPGRAFTSGYAMGFFLRLSFSALVDADHLDTEAFMSPARTAARRLQPLPPLADLKRLLDARLARFGPPTTPVNRARAAVLDACRAAAVQTPGLFSLTVPTGGGKTLASLAFALEHALRHGMERVIYVLPFTSIIEQNAAVFRDLFAPLGVDLVLEHHSNLDPDAAHRTPAARLASENWHARVIVTTNVQFFESLHSNRPSACRRLHRLARSVIILDEAQTLPVTLLRPCLRALEELTATTPDGRAVYGSSIVLCTATQPAITRRADFPSGLDGVREIIPDRATLFADLARVRVTDLGRMPLPDVELAARLAAHPRVLCIVNTRRHAAALYQLLPADGARFHLSALMCPEHRATLLGDPREPAPGTIRHALRHGLPCRVIATQLIEAGVDVDFPVVYRALAGLDSIAQAAGRCNREGRLNEQGLLGETYVFQPEASIPAGFLRQSADSAAEILPVHAADPLSPAAVEAYFRLHYWRNERQTDAKSVLDCFPSRLARPEDLFGLRFKDCAERFRIIESAYESVIVPYGQRGRELVAELRATYAPSEQNALARRLQRFVVQIPAAQARAALGRGLVQLHERFLVLDDDGAYSAELGLQLATERGYDPELLITA